MPGVLMEKGQVEGDSCKKTLMEGQSAATAELDSGGDVLQNGRTAHHCSRSDSEPLESSTSETEADKSSSSETRCDSGGVLEEVGSTGVSEEVEGASKSPMNILGTASEEVGGATKCPLKRPGTTMGDSCVYNIHLSIPGVAHAVDVVLTSRDTIHDLLQFAVGRSECCYRTALSVHHKGKRLDDFFEIGSVEGLADGDTVEVVEEPYMQRDVRLHMQRLKDLLTTDPVQQSLLGSDGLSLSFLSTIASMDAEDGSIRASSASDLAASLEVPDYIMPHEPGSCDAPDTPLSHFYPANLRKHFKFPECLKSLRYSSWNPPLSHRKMKGDLLYLELTTLEGQDCYITATSSGFFLNKSTNRENFDPTPRKTPHLHKHLVGLLNQISPLFKKNFAQLQKFGEGLHAYEILPVPYPVIPWASIKPEHKPLNFRIDDSMSLRVLPDELVLGQMRDWNEELQIAREFVTDTPSAKVFRDRALFKIHSDFVQACTRGAAAVVEGCLPSINPGDEPKFRMYMWNNIFFSLAFDGRDHYKEFGGDNAAHAAAAADLQGVASYEKMEQKDLYTLGTVLVDYRGYRVVCQSIIPGLLQREHESAVIYGSIDTGKNVNTEPHFCELLTKSAEELHIRHHSVRTEKGDVVKLPSSLEIKGIIGNDGRHYALDLFRIFPPDANYMDLPEGSTYRHKMAVLRPEFLDTFLSFKFMLFLKLVKEKADLLKKCIGEESTTHSETGHEAEASTTPSETGHEAEESTMHLETEREAEESTTHPETEREAEESTTHHETGREAEKSTAPPETEREATTHPETGREAVKSTAPPETEREAEESTIHHETGREAEKSTVPPEIGCEAEESTLPRKTAEAEESAMPPETGWEAEESTLPPKTGSEAEESTTTHMTGHMAKESTLPPKTGNEAEGSTTCIVPASPIEIPATVDIRSPPDTISKIISTIEGGRNRTSVTEEFTTADAAQPKVSVYKPHSISRSTSSSTSRIVLSALASSSKPLLSLGTKVDLEGLSPDELLLLDTQALTEEKEVGPDIPRGLVDEDLSRDMVDKQQLNGSDARNPEVMSAFQAALTEVGSSSTEEFAIRFNVDILSPQVQHADDEATLKKDRGLVKDASTFLRESMVPRFVHDCIQLLVTPLDGEGLTLAMHARGINMRYLGQLAKLAVLREDLQHLLRLCLSEMTVRLAKRRMRRLLQETPLEKTSECICHFLNCLLSNMRVDGRDEALSNGHVRRRRNKKKISRVQKLAVHLKLVTRTLWEELVEEMGWYYKFDMKYSSLSEMCVETGVSKLSLLRNLCKKTGVQVFTRDYNFSIHPVFTEDDIIAVFPLVKHTNFRPVDPASLFDLALAKFSSGQLQLAYELFANVLQMLVQVYGPMHLDIATCYRQMAQIEDILNSPAKALASQHKATLILERVLGVDHSETIAAYINLALYCHATNQSASALKLLYRARYLLLLVYGEDHPELATCDSNIAIILHSLRDFQQSHTFLLSALVTHNRYHGKESLQVALTHHLLARVQSFLGDFRAALVHEKVTFTIYNKKFGADHYKTKESSQCLKDLTGKAVSMQKTINEMTGKGSGVGKVRVELPGSWGEVVDMVNGTNSTTENSKQHLIKSKTHVTKKKNRGVKQQLSPLSFPTSASSSTPAVEKNQS